LLVTSAGGDAADAVAGAQQLRVAVRVETLPPAMHAAIDFDDEVGDGADGIGDVATDDRVATEREAQAAAFERGPQAQLGGARCILGDALRARAGA
jgi:hypothetical protein